MSPTPNLTIIAINLYTWFPIIDVIESNLSSNQSYLGPRIYDTGTVGMFMLYLQPRHKKIIFQSCCFQLDTCFCTQKRNKYPGWYLLWYLQNLPLLLLMKEIHSNFHHQPPLQQKVINLNTYSIVGINQLLTLSQSIQNIISNFMLLATQQQCIP